ncbi:alpha/beta fold hydrolase [Deinococcus malanensis]|uniref:alpha/beta fold hydrolase n=1 Tax=Deinococcus malanensis TaxID=1706855 RepID=UPI00364573B9
MDGRQPRLHAGIAAGADEHPFAPEVYARQFRSTSTHDVTGDLSRLDLPTLVIHGDADPLVRYENGEHLARSIPGAQFITYAGTGHLPPLEQYEQFNRDVLTFVDAH